MNFFRMILQTEMLSSTKYFARTEHEAPSRNSNAAMRLMCCYNVSALIVLLIGSVIFIWHFRA